MFSAPKPSPLFHLHVSHPISDKFAKSKTATRKNEHMFDISILATEIYDTIITQLTTRDGLSDEFKNSIRKSPVFCAISSGFGMIEYIKNILDAHGTRIDIYIHATRDLVQCVILDNGTGFTNKKMVDPSANTLVDMHAKLCDASGYYHNENISDKVGSTDNYGKNGSGLESIERILHLAEGKLQIGLAHQLPQAVLTTLQISRANHTQGAALFLQSPPYSLGAYAAYRIKQRILIAASYGSDSNSERYTQYVKSLEHADEMRRNSLPISLNRQFAGASFIEQKISSAATSAVASSSCVSPSHMPRQRSISLRIGATEAYEYLNPCSPIHGIEPLTLNTIIESPSSLDHTTLATDLSINIASPTSSYPRSRISDASSSSSTSSCSFFSATPSSMFTLLSPQSMKTPYAAESKHARRWSDPDLNLTQLFQSPHKIPHPTPDSAVTPEELELAPSSATAFSARKI